VSRLLERGAYDPRDDALFLAEMNELTRAHLAGCEPYRRMWPAWAGAEHAGELPFVHATVFKHVELRTEGSGIVHQRTLRSSATSGQAPSRVALDAASSELQARSTRAILADFVGDAKRPLFVLDSAAALRERGGVSARVAAALALQPFASEIHFLLPDPNDPASLRWDVVEEVLDAQAEALVYGFTWMLWLAWAEAARPRAAGAALRGKRLHFVHSGGWKKLETLAVDRATFDARLLEGLAPGSRVVDYYGLVEQVGVVYPLCEKGARHVPGWSEVLVRDPCDLELLDGSEGQLQLLNTLARGAPYHSVLTEDVGRLLSGPCPCGRAGRRFELLGRVPQAETRGCANV
jgi:hypothetical protein